VKADALKFTQVVGTKLGTLLGTPQYMSPEQVRGSSTVDHRTDLWALAIIACECLTGRYPFPGTSIGDLSVQICTERPLAPSTLGPVPSGFDQWFFKGTSKKPSGRFASVEEMADALEKILLAPGASSSSSAASGWLVGLRDRVQVRRLWDVARSGLNPISAVVRRNVDSMGHALSTFAPMLRTERFARAIQRLNVQRLLSARSAWMVPALLIVVCGIALIWSRRRGEPAMASQEREASTAVQAASPAPVAAETVSPEPTGTSAPPTAPAPEAREDGTPPNAAADGSEAASAPAIRRPRKASAPSSSATQTPFGKMSVAMGQAGARIASGDTQRDAARPTPAPTEKLRAPAAKAAKGSPVDPSPRQR
jgi:serine/threonine-protein kinase